MKKTRRNQATRFRISEAERAALEEAARRNGGTISDALRVAINETYVKRQGKGASAEVYQTGGACPVLP